LAAQIKGSYLRRTREDAGIVLPKQTITVHDIEFDKDKYPRQAEILKTLKENSQVLIEAGKAVDMASLLALITRQRQAAVWPGGIWMDVPVDPKNPWTSEYVRTHVGANFLESATIDRAVELADEFVEAGERYVLFSQFREAIDEFARRRGAACAVYHGGTSEGESMLIKDNFDRQRLIETGEQAKWEGVAAHYLKGGVGLTLTAATQCIILDEQWSPGMNQQAYDRINRLGQTEETGVHILHLENTIDQWLMDLIEEKRKVVEGFEMELTFQQLADVFMSMDM
jgi:SNF2 family DNA or RNA helicase